jgi:hypothetical protein
MSSEIIESVAYDNYDDFQHVNFIFSQNFISLWMNATLATNKSSFIKIKKSVDGDWYDPSKLSIQENTRRRNIGWLAQIRT